MNPSTNRQAAESLTREQLVDIVTDVQACLVDGRLLDDFTAWKPKVAPSTARATTSAG